MRRLFAALVAMWTASGCGPIEYVNQVPRRAVAEVEAAEAVANDKSPEYIYWHTLAVEYLRKAREEAALADFQAANRLGRKAELAAAKARRAALDPQLTFPDEFAGDDAGDGEADPAAEDRASPAALRSAPPPSSSSSSTVSSSAMAR